MFEWFKRKKENADDELKKRLAKKLAIYNASDASEDTTHTTFTEIDFGHGPVKIPKINITGDVWEEADPHDTTQWRKDEENA